MGHLNGILARVGGNLNNNFQKSQMPGGLPGGGMLKLRFDRYITLFIFKIIVKIRIHHQTRSGTLYKLIYRGTFYPSFFLCTCERSFETASFCLKFWLFSSRRPRKLILPIFSKSKRCFEKQTTPRLVTYLCLYMDKI